MVCMLIWVDMLRCSNNSRRNLSPGYGNCTPAYKVDRAGQDSLCVKLRTVTH